MRAKIFLVVGAVFATLLIMTAALSQGVPELINYQGRLTDSAGAPLDGVTVDLTFSFYGVDSGGTAYLSVLQEDVLVTGGLYNVLIGSGTIIPGTESFLTEVFQKHRDVWMGVMVDADPEMALRARITSVPFTMKVDTAWLTAFTGSDDFDQDGNPKSNDCDDGDASIGPPSIWQKLGSDLRVTSDPDASYYPSLSWTGSEFGVAWHDYRDTETEVYFARVSTDGATIGPDIRVTYANDWSEFPSLAWTGSEFGLCWQDDRDGAREIYFNRLSADGSTIGSDVRVTIWGWSYFPSLSWTGSEFGMSWRDDRDGNSEIYFARVSAAGVKIGADLRVTSNLYGSDYPSLSWSGTEFGVSWADSRDDMFNFEIYFARIALPGVKIGSDLRLTNDNQDSDRPSLAWTGSEFAVSWHDYRDVNYEVYFTRVSASGSKVGPDIRVTNNVGNSFIPSLLWTGSEFGVSWYDNTDGPDEIYFVRLSEDGTKLGSDLRVTNTAFPCQYPSLVWTGSEFGVGWQDERDSIFFPEIYFARISPTCP